MSGSDLARAYQEGLAAATDPRAVNPYAPAEPNTLGERLAQMWRRGRLKHALDVPDDE